MTQRTIVLCSFPACDERVDDGVWFCRHHVRSRDRKNWARKLGTVVPPRRRTIEDEAA